MAEGQTRRRLAAILAADIAGFSRLIGADEEGTLAAQRAHRTELIDPLLGQHNGRVANTAGDSLLIEFPSAVEAVRFAVAVQVGMRARNADIPNNQRIEFRIGVNVGDVVAESEAATADLLGDGVNIAARLEALAPPDGIIISRSVRDQVRDRLTLELADLGEAKVKNIVRPVHAFQVLVEGEIAIGPPKHKRRLAMVGLIAAAALLVAAGFYVWEFANRAGTTKATIFDRAAILATPTGPAIAVFPFADIGGGQDGDYFAEGMTLEIMSELGAYPDLRVFSKASTFRLKGDARDPRRIGADLGADYVLEGDIRRADNRVRVTGRLIATKTGQQIWGEIFDEDLTPANLFDVQSKVAQKVGVAIGGKSVGVAFAEQKARARRKPSKELSAYECGLFSLGGFFRPDVMRRRFECASAAVAAEPDFADGWRILSNVYIVDAIFEFRVSGLGREDAIAKAMETAETAARFDPENPKTLFRLVQAHMIAGEREKFLAACNRFLSAKGKDATQLGWVGQHLAWAGKWDLGTDIIEKAISLSPGNYVRQWRYSFVFEAYSKGDHEGALRHLRKAAYPGFWWTDMRYAQIYAAMGRSEDAKAAIAEMLKKKPGYTVADAVGYMNLFLFEDEFIAKFAKDMKTAGLPSGGYGE